ncbi:variable large family protein (plasmid) [Borrelia turicatae 91E135]|nr:variable large family protein [Borrelia turicatae]UPA14176.1 variable large family protein [Borrelia turicatae 91E135]UPA14240.1 variable large family protein [Borrelia turicatae 91E135]
MKLLRMGNSKLKSVVDTFVTGSLDKIVDGAKEAAKGATGDDKIGGATNVSQDAVPADTASVNSLVKGIKTIVDVGLKKDEGSAGATKTGDTEQKSIGKLFDGSTGAGADDKKAATDAAKAVGAVTGADILQAMVKDNGDAAKLAAEVSKADPWAMIDKIQNAKTKTGVLDANTDKGSGQLATGTGVADVKAATNADLAAAVALKAMTKGGKFTQPNDNEDADISGAAVTAVNKVLGILDFIIRKTVSINLDKIREAVKGIQYSEPTTESTEASTITQPATTK